MSGERIHLHIDELVVDGFDPGRGFDTDLQRELSRLVGERGLSIGARESVGIDRLDAGQVDVSNSRGGSSVGSRIGRAIYGALDR